MEVVFVSLQIALSIAFPVMLIRRDLARLSPERLARAWNDASLWSAAAAFGPLCLIIHFARTRRSLFGFVLGIFWTLVGFAVLMLLGLSFGG